MGLLVFYVFEPHLSFYPWLETRPLVMASKHLGITSFLPCFAVPMGLRFCPLYQAGSGAGKEAPLQLHGLVTCSTATCTGSRVDVYG